MVDRQERIDHLTDKFLSGEMTSLEYKKRLPNDPIDLWQALALAGIAGLFVWLFSKK